MTVTNVTNLHDKDCDVVTVLADEARRTRILTRKKVDSSASEAMINLELNFRLALSSDFDEILKLSEGIYDGDDYLPLIYNTWMKMKNVAVILILARSL